MAEPGSNPFRPGGEYYSDAEKILRNSTICRDKVIINDPTVHMNGTCVEGDISKTSNDHVQCSKKSDSQQRLVTCEVRRDVVSAGLSAEGKPLEGDPNLTVEHVKIKKGGMKCCSIS